MAGTESHTGQIFVSVAALYIAGAETSGVADSDVLAWWCVTNNAAALTLGGDCA